MRILAIGDIVGEAGLGFLGRRLRELRRQTGADLVVVNGENASGTGLTPQQAEDMLDAGADVITLGNHAFRRREILHYLDEQAHILRPLNFAPQSPGRGWGEFETACGPVRVVNLIGRCEMDFGPDNPFHAIDRVLREAPMPTVVDFHAGATSEKLAMAWYLDGRVSALWGTHTHVQTSDAEVFPGGMGYITDLGMTGPKNSVLGVRPEQSISMFRGDPRVSFQTAKGPRKLEGALFTIEEATGRCTAVEPLRLVEGKEG